MSLQNVPHALGRELRFFAEPEVTAGTYVRATSAGAIKVKTIDFDPKIERNPRRDAQEGQQDSEMITGRSENSFVAEKRVAPSGALGVAPDESVLLQAIMGLPPVINAGVDVRYSLGVGCVTASLTRFMNATDPVLMEAMIGAVMNEMKVSFSGGEDPMMSFTGEAMRHVATGRATLQGAVAGATGLITGADEADGFELDSVIQVGADDNGGTGHLLTAAGGTALTSASAITANDQDPIRPFAPVPTTSGRAVSLTQGSFVMDGVTYCVKSGEINVNRNFNLFKDCAFESSFSDGTPGRRDVTGSFVIRARADYVREQARRKRFIDRALTVTLGATPGSIMEFVLGRIELEVGKTNVPEDVEADIPINFRALDTVDGANDALVIICR